MKPYFGLSSHLKKSLSSRRELQILADLSAEQGQQVTGMNPCQSVPLLPDSKAGTERGGVTKKPEFQCHHWMVFAECLTGLGILTFLGADSKARHASPEAYFAPWLIFICLPNPVMVPG